MRPFVVWTGEVTKRPYSPHMLSTKLDLKQIRPFLLHPIEKLIIIKIISLSMDFKKHCYFLLKFWEGNLIFRNGLKRGVGGNSSKLIKNHCSKLIFFFVLQFHKNNNKLKETFFKTFGN